MCKMISCLVDRSARVFAFDGVHSHAKIAEMASISEDSCLKYEYRIKEKKLVQDFDSDSAPFVARQSHDNAALNFFEAASGTPEKLIAFVQRGNWDEAELVPLLNKESRKTYDAARDAAWKTYYAAYDAAGKTCCVAYIKVWIKLT